MSFSQLRLRYETFTAGHGQYVERQKTQREGTMWDEAVPWDGEKEREICAVAPPLECFMNIPDNIKKQHFFQSISMHDYFIGEVAAVHETGLILKLVCMDGGMARDLEACKLLAAVSLRNIPALQAHTNPLDGFQVTDKVRAFIIDKDGPTQRIWASLNPSDLPSHLLDVQLGLINDEDMPAHFRAITGANNRSFEQCLISMPQYNNNGGVEHVCEKLGIDLRKPVSLMHTINKLKIEPHQYADELRKKQMSKLALKHVTKGVEYFRSKKHTEAMQCFNFALTVDGNHVEGLVARGALYATLSTYKKAMEDLERALELEPSHKNAINYLSQVLVVYGREVMKSENAWSKADAYFRRALKMNPWMEEAKEALYDLYKEEQKHKIAPKSRISDEGSQDEAGKSTSDVTRAQRLLLKLVNSDEKKNSKALHRTEADYNAWEESDEEKDMRDDDYGRRVKKRSSLPRGLSPQDMMYSPDSPTKVDNRSPTKMPKFDLYRDFGPGKGVGGTTTTTPDKQPAGTLSLVEKVTGFSELREVSDERKRLSPFDDQEPNSRSRRRQSPPRSPKREMAPAQQKSDLSTIDWLAPFREKPQVDNSGPPTTSRRDMRFMSRPKQPESKTVDPPPAPPSLMDINMESAPPAPPAPSFPSFVPTLRPVLNFPDTSVPPPMFYQGYPPQMMPPGPPMQQTFPPASNIPQTSPTAPGALVSDIGRPGPASAAPKAKSHPFMRKNVAATGTAAGTAAAMAATTTVPTVASKIKVAEATLDTADTMMRSALSGGLTVSASEDGGRRVISYRPKDKEIQGNDAKDEGKPRNYRRRSASRSPPHMKTDRPPPPRRRGGRGRGRGRNFDYDYEAEVDAFLNRIRPNDDKRTRRRSRSGSSSRYRRSPDRGPRRRQRSSSSERRRHRRSMERSRERRSRDRDRDRRRGRDRNSRERDRSRELVRNRERGRDSDRSIPEVAGRNDREADIESSDKKESKRQPARRKLFMPTEKEYQELSEPAPQPITGADAKGKPQLDISRINKTIRGIEERVRSRRDDSDAPEAPAYPRFSSQPYTRPIMGPRGAFNQSMRPRFPIQTRPIRPQRHERPQYRPPHRPPVRAEQTITARPQVSNMSGNLAPQSQKSIAPVAVAAKPTTVGDDDVMIIDPPHNITKAAPAPTQPQQNIALDSVASKPANGTSTAAAEGAAKEPEGSAVKKKKPVRSLAEFDKFMKTLKNKKK